jgi:hypothetical protein
MQMRDFRMFSYLFNGLTKLIVVCRSEICASMANSPNWTE